MANKTKTREPYGKVTEVGQVPIALQEIQELAGKDRKLVGRDALGERLLLIKNMADSVIAVTCANPGCLSQMAEASQMEVES